MPVKTRDHWVEEGNCKIKLKTTQLSSSSVSHQPRDLNSKRGIISSSHQSCAEARLLPRTPRAGSFYPGAPTIGTVTSFSFRPISEQGVNSARQSSLPFCKCCYSDQSEEDSICAQCWKMLCRSCLQLPLGIKDCGDCCRQICEICCRQICEICRRNQSLLQTGKCFG